MGEYKTPGVYIKEKNAFGNSIVEAATAIPAFIGYTEKAQNGNDNLTGVPWKISSMTEFIQYFGGGPNLRFTVDIKKYFYQPDPTKEQELKEELKEPTANIFKHCVCPEGEIGNAQDNDGKDLLNTPVGYAFCVDGNNNYTLYYNMMLFFANGGGSCYVVSVGNYEDTLDKDTLINALEKLKLEQEITIVVIPEAVNLSAEEFKDVQTQMLSHCGDKMKNRFALLDIYPKANENTRINSQIEVFWNNIGSNFLSYGAAYYPWLNTSIVSDRDLAGNMFTFSTNALRYREKIGDAFSMIVCSFMGTSQVVKANETIDLSMIVKDKKEIQYDELTDELAADLGLVITTEDKDGVQTKIVCGIPIVGTEIDYTNFHQALNSGSQLYQQAMKAIKKKLNLLPPSAAMAGIYTMVDNSRGVWKAPANVTLSYVDSPTEDIDDDQQAGLNAPMNGKAINVIRPFRGEGIKVWGARTLDGNSLDWRYINVRRTLLFLEESVKNAARAYVFEPNDAGTWINMKCMIENFLRSVWKRGGLAGATPEDAYEVHIGLGDTMTGEDILEGIMRITVLVAVSRPAEFIEITFQQQMQKS